MMVILIYFIYTCLLLLKYLKSQNLQCEQLAVLSAVSASTNKLKSVHLVLTHSRRYFFGMLQIKDFVFELNNFIHSLKI